jgi:hypothetical protein
MSENFSAIWKNRNSTNPVDQTALYLELQKIFLRSSVAAWLNNDGPERSLRDDFFQDFYLNKIFYALKVGKAISSAEYDDTSKGGLINMMKRHHISFYRKERIRISSDKGNTDNVEDYSLTDPTDNIDQQHTQREMRDKAILFINNSPDQWMHPLLLKSAKGEKLSGSDYPRRAKLGLTLRQSFHTGAQSIDDYHQNTIIGRWVTATYIDEAAPLSQNFLADILKSLHQAALYINKKDRYL